MKKVKITLKLDEHTILRLAEFDNINKGVSDIIINSFLKSNTQFNSKDPKGLLDRTYAYHKRSQSDISYSRTEFVDRYLKDKVFMDMFNNYTASGYNKNEMPSFKKAPKLKDVRLMTYYENMSIGRKQRAVVYSQHGKEPQYFRSVNEARRKTGKQPAPLGRMLKAGATGRHGADEWFYYKDEYKKYMKKSKKLLQLD